jgi:hypothetical protein
VVIGQFHGYNFIFSLLRWCSCVLYCYLMLCCVSICAFLRLRLFYIRRILHVTNNGCLEKWLDQNFTFGTPRIRDSTKWDEVVKIKAQTASSGFVGPCSA